MARVSSNLFDLLVVAALCVHIIGLSSALPTVNSVAPPKPQEITGKLEAVATVAAASGATGPSTTQAGVEAGSSPKPSVNIKRNVYANNAEKLKRGLTNFMNNLNPAPYFVPPKAAVVKSAAPVAGSQAEPATIVNDGSSAEVVIKGPNRLVQARQLGGPLRWGRR